LRPARRIEQSFEHAEWWCGTKSAGWEFRDKEGPCLAVPAAICELLAEELIGQCVVGFLEIPLKAEDSAVDAGLRFRVRAV